MRRISWSPPAQWIPSGFDALREAMSNVLAPFLTGATRHAEHYVAVAVGLRWAKSRANRPVDKYIWPLFGAFERGLLQYWHLCPGKGRPAQGIKPSLPYNSDPACVCSRYVLRELMSATTQIEWTDATWNPVTGCSKITRGCDLCYAERFSERFRGVPGHPFENGFDLTLRPERLTQPLHWLQPRRIFVNSMSDLFHKEVPRSFINSVFDTMEAADWHTFQVLTKRSSLMARYLRSRYGSGLAPPHIWLGVSIEDAKKRSKAEIIFTPRKRL